MKIQSILRDVSSKTIVLVENLGNYDISIFVEFESVMLMQMSWKQELKIQMLVAIIIILNVLGQVSHHWIALVSS